MPIHRHRHREGDPKCCQAGNFPCAGYLICLEKAFITVPREMVMATLRWMGVPEAEVRIVEGTY